MSRPYKEDFSVLRFRKGGSTRYFTSGIGATAGTTGALVANTLYAFPFLVVVTEEFDRISINVTTLGSGNARLGVYVDDGTIAPGRLVLDAGTVSVSSTGVKEITPSPYLVLIGGKLYWLAIVTNIACTIRAVALGSLISSFLGIDSGIGTAWGVGMNRSFTYAALPDPFGTPTIVTTVVGSGVFLRKV